MQFLRATSLLFGVYVSHFARYNVTYGALGAVVSFLMWLYVAAYTVLLGAEINAEIEHQTARDSTTGPEAPAGERGAEMADTTAGVAAPVAAVEPVVGTSRPRDPGRTVGDVLVGIVGGSAAGRALALIEAPNLTFVPRVMIVTGARLVGRPKRRVLGLIAIGIGVAWAWRSGGAHAHRDRSTGA